MSVRINGIVIGAPGQAHRPQQTAQDSSLEPSGRRSRHEAPDTRLSSSNALTGDDLVEIVARIISRTDRAIQVDDGGRRYWLPIAQIDVRPVPASSTDAIDDETAVVAISMPRWLAEDRALCSAPK